MMQIEKRNMVGDPILSATSATLTATFLISVHISIFIVSRAILSNFSYQKIYIFNIFIPYISQQLTHTLTYSLSIYLLTWFSVPIPSYLNLDNFEYF